MLNYIWITFASTSNLQLGGLNIATAGWHAGKCLHRVASVEFHWLSLIRGRWFNVFHLEIYRSQRNENTIRFDEQSLTDTEDLRFVQPRGLEPDEASDSGCLVRWWWVMMALYKDAKIHCETYHKQIVALFRKYTKTVPTLSRHVDLSPRFRHEVWCGSLGSSMGRVCLSYCNRNLQADGTSSELPWKQETNSK